AVGVAEPAHRDPELGLEPGAAREDLVALRVLVQPREDWVADGVPADRHSGGEQLARHAPGHPLLPAGLGRRAARAGAGTEAVDEVLALRAGQRLDSVEQRR